MIGDCESSITSGFQAHRWKNKKVYPILDISRAYKSVEYIWYLGFDAIYYFYNYRIKIIKSGYFYSKKYPFFTVSTFLQ